MTGKTVMPICFPESSNLATRPTFKKLRNCLKNVRIPIESGRLTAGFTIGETERGKLRSRLSNVNVLFLKGVFNNRLNVMGTTHVLRRKIYFPRHYVYCYWFLMEVF